MSRRCCGEVARGRAPRRPAEPLPDNPDVKGGVRLIYVGAGTHVARGAGSGLRYTVSDRRRMLRVDVRDVEALLRDRRFMLRP